MPEQVRPILKWAGGKRQLLPALRPFYPKRFSRYLEPFLGSGAVYLDLLNSGRLAGRTVALSDVNSDIVGCYRTVRDQVDTVIAQLRDLEYAYLKEGNGLFYQVRDERFNPARRRLQGSRRPAEGYTPALAAMLIFLNRTGFNGLFRVNGRGDFNVPAGRHARPTICDEGNLRAFQAALRRPQTSLEAASFDETLAGGRRGDFIYLDPPYAPVSGTARFTNYTSGGFDAEAQSRLRNRVGDLVRRGAQVLLSNSAVPEIRDLYTRHRPAQLKMTTIAARRAINSRASSRGPVREYLITNVRRSA